jgi:hypothetical protein
VNGLAQKIALAKSLAAGLRRIGQISVAVRKDGTFSLAHREGAARNDLTVYGRAENAAEIARFDDAGEYRPLKTAPNLRLALCQEACHLLVAEARQMVKSKGVAAPAP